jgi:hypothetical protein
MIVLSAVGLGAPVLQGEGERSFFLRSAWTDASAATPERMIVLSGEALERSVGGAGQGDRSF